MRVTSWMGDHSIPSDEIPDKASEVLASEWHALFTAWMLTYHRHREKYMYAMTLVQQRRVDYISIGQQKTAGEIPEEHEQKVREFLSLYEKNEKLLTKLIPDFVKDFQHEIKRGVPENPVDRIAGQKLDRQIEFHRKNWDFSRGTGAHYIGVADALLKIPDSVIDHVPVAKKRFGGRNEMPADGIDLRKAEHSRFLQFKETAAGLMQLAVNHLASVDALYRTGDTPIWKLDATGLQGLGDVHVLLRGWYDSTESLTTRFLTQAQTLLGKCEKYLLKIATPQLVKVLDEVAPVHAGAGMALRGLAGAIGVAAATVSPMIGPASLPIGFLATGVMKAAVKVEKSGSKKAVKEDPRRLESTVLGRVKPTSYIKQFVQGSKGAAMGIDTIDKWATEFEAWNLAAQGSTAGQLATPIATAMEAAGVPLAGISGMLGLGTQGAMYASDKTLVDKFASAEVREAMSAVVRKVIAEKGVTHQDLVKEAQRLTDRHHAVLRTFAKNDRVFPWQLDEDIRISLSTAGLVAGRPKFVAMSEDNARFIFKSSDVKLVGEIAYATHVHSVVWQCMADGTFKPERDILRVVPGEAWVRPGHDWPALTKKYREFIGSKPSLLAFVHHGLNWRWLTAWEGSTVNTAQVRYGDLLPVVEEYITCWNEKQKALTEKYGALARGTQYEAPSWYGSPAEQELLYQSDAIEMASPGDGILPVYKPKDLTSKPLLLQVALLNRANGYTDAFLRSSTTWDTFDFDIDLTRF